MVMVIVWWSELFEYLDGVFRTDTPGLLRAAVIR